MKFTAPLGEISLLMNQNRSNGCKINVETNPTDFCKPSEMLGDFIPLLLNYSAS